MTADVNGNRRGNRARSLRTGWRAVGATVLCLCIQLCLPRRADAFIDWLDHLSGPGPFRGEEFSFQLLCIGDQPSSQQAVQTLLGAGSTRLVLNPAVAAAALTPTEQRAAAIQNIDIGPFLNLQLSSSLQSALFDALQGNKAASKTELLEAAGAIDRVYLHPPASSAQANAASVQAGVRTAWERAQQTLLEAAAPQARALPGIGLWSTCRDHPKLVHEDYRIDAGAFWNAQSVGRRHRRPVLTLNANYRFYTNGRHWPLPAPQRNPDYAGGNTIHLHVFEIQPSLPLTGRLDVLDVQSGVGMYWFTSSNERPGSFPTFTGVILEPVRFDLHVPGWVVDKADEAGHRYWRPFLAWSFHFGWVKFPGGFTPADFNATGDATHSIPSNEAVFETGIVFNVGRLLGL